MGIFDIFSTKPAEDAAQAQIAGLNRGYDAASGSINQGIGALNTNYTKALQPYLQNYTGATAGTTQLGNVLGLNGAAGNDAALTALRSTPGYKFQQQTLDDTVNAQAAASGMNASGNQLLALNKVNQGLADSTYGQYVSQLQPYLGAAGGAAAGIGNTYTGLGNATAGQYDALGQLGYSKETGVGNANANADLSAYNASGNFWNMLGGFGGMKMPGGGTAGGNAMSSLWGSGGGGVDPASGAGGGGGSGIMGGISSLMAMFSDERLKEDIERVGELTDGQPVYKYRYIGSPVFQIGLMAQDVEQTYPEAVIDIGGYKAVNYDKATRFAGDLSRFLEAA